MAPYKVGLKCNSFVRLFAVNVYLFLTLFYLYINVYHCRESRYSFQTKEDPFCINFVTL